MYITGETIDDILHEVLSQLVKLPFDIKTSRGVTSEISGVLIELNNPIARISRSETKGKIISAIGELIWYLSGRNDLEFIKYYIKQYEKDAEAGVIKGGYGPRFLNFRGKFNQFQRIEQLLKKKQSTRRAVIQLLDVEDIHSDRKEIPCTCFLQFLVRDGKLDLIASMRSNDAFWGLPHDIFTFTMIQEIFANKLNFQLGKYTHFVSSLHLYEDKKEEVVNYLNEGFQSKKAIMKEMPKMDITATLSLLFDAEKIIRLDPGNYTIDDRLDDYWADIVRILRVYAFQKQGNKILMENEKRLLHNKDYIGIIDTKIRLSNNRR